MRMLPHKKYYFMVEATKACQLSFAARWVYSFLVFRTSVNKPASGACIFRNCGLSNRAVKDYLAELREKGLLDDRWNVTVRPEHHHYWRDADHLANPRSRSEVGYASLRECVLDCLNGYECYLCFGNLYEMGMHLDRCEQVMKRAGYNQRQIIDYWSDVVFEAAYCDRQCRLIEVFAGKGFMPVFKMAEDMTVQNRITKGYVGISLGLLRKLTQYEMLTIKDMAARKNSNGESLLRYYEPNHERLRSGAGTAA